MYPGDLALYKFRHLTQSYTAQIIPKDMNRYHQYFFSVVLYSDLSSLEDGKQINLVMVINPEKQPVLSENTWVILMHAECYQYHPAKLSVKKPGTVACMRNQVIHKN